MLAFFLTSKIGRSIGVALAVLAAVGLVYKSGMSSQKKNDIIKDNKEYIETRGKIDDAIKDSPITADAAREWLLRRNKH